MQQCSTRELELPMLVRTMLLCTRSRNWVEPSKDRPSIVDFPAWVSCDSEQTASQLARPAVIWMHTPSSSYFGLLSLVFLVLVFSLFPYPMSAPLLPTPPPVPSPPITRLPSHAT